MTVAKIAIEGAQYSFDREFSYLVPPELLSAAVPGSLCVVPFGASNRRKNGLILACGEEEGGQLKSILEIKPGGAFLNSEQLFLVREVKNRSFCTFFDAAKVMIPAGARFRMQFLLTLCGESDQSPLAQALLKRGGSMPEREALKSFSETEVERLISEKIAVRREESLRFVRDASMKMVRPLPDFSSEKLKGRQAEVFELLTSAGEASQKELCYLSGVGTGVVDALVKKGAAEYFLSEVFRIPYDDPEEKREEILLSADQQSAFSNIISMEQTGGTALLYGVTGSGKTAVYMKLADRMREKNRSVMILVPEISLTPQTVSLFVARYGKEVAVLHSALTLGERLDEWKRIRRGDAKIVVGTRSAVFAPLSGIGLIVLDEEQEGSYKSESAPRYHARDIARIRGAYHKAITVLSSATPSVESRYLAEIGKYKLCVLPQRFGTSELPQVLVADMNEERLCGNESIFSSVLMKAIEKNLSEKKQSILLLNRRGFHNFALCTACRAVVRCKNCSIAMRYHAANHRLVCHYCGYSIPFTEECPECHEKKLSYRGFGTQMAEKELSELFPQARVLRLDADTATGRAYFDRSMKDFSEGKYDLLIGTQMVAKGLDFENVTLVGVLSADQELYAEDFRSGERAFALLTQVVGRSGRGKYPGIAVIQTFTPENPVIALAAAQDYESFYRQELPFRKALLYPPFSDLCVITFSSEEEEKARAAAVRFLEKARETAESKYPLLPLRMMNPAAAAALKVSGKYRWRLLIKCRNTSKFREMLSGLLVGFKTEKGLSEVTVTADMNPDSAS